MIERIKQLEQEARKLEPTPTIRENWNKAVINYGNNFIDDIEKLKAFNANDDGGKAILDIPFSEGGKSIDELLPLIKENIDRKGINPASGGHLGYIPGGGIYSTALGDYLAALTNRYSGIFFANPGAVRIENAVIRWMCQFIGYPPSALGNLTSGGSIANLIAIVTARDAKKIKATQIEKSVIYLTEQVHHAAQKAIRIAGLGEAILRYIPMDEQFRLDTQCLKERIRQDIAHELNPFLLIGSAGTTDTGAIDPLDELADIAQQYDLWFHVDAAYGGFFALLEECKKAFKGIERSDSLIIDPHKGLFLAYGTGAVLIKNVEAQYQSHYYQAAYMQDALSDNGEPSPADLSPELTKHFRGMRMWLSLQLLGTAPFKAALEEKLLLCHYFYQKVQELGFEVGPLPALSVAIYRYIPPHEDANHFNQKLVQYVQDDGRVFLSSTTINGQFWIRIAILSFRTHLREIDLCLDILKAGVEALVD